MKLAIIGGGGFRVPLVYRALLDREEERRIEQVALYDTDPARLAVMESILAAQADRARSAPAVTTSTELDQALSGSDFVFSAIRVGGLAGRTQDERVALKLGVLGQETTGPGGIAYGMRTVPVAMQLAERIAAVAPNAFVINFTNPAGMVTEAMQRILGPRVVGICDTPSGLGRRIAVALGLDPARVQLDYIGLNHLGWMRGVIEGGRDHLPDLLADDERLEALEESALFGPSWLRTLGVVPNEYLYYYYCNREAVQKIAGRSETRGEFLLHQQADFYARAGADPQAALDIWQRTVSERHALYMADAKGGREQTDEPGGYEDVALAVMGAITRNERSTMILNVRNGTAVPGLDPDAVVEIPALVDAQGAHPLATSAPDLHQLGLMASIKAVERHAITAATTGSAESAVRAFATHPLVDSVSVGHALLRGYRAAIPDLDRIFTA
ncbi:MAG TPA: 6-phospho-beta-glucosidase [Mycobacteriales bacterium]|nr:6-phospho-beta-glucosidase [Mycobacteriales bacterium]